MSRCSRGRFSCASPRKKGRHFRGFTPEAEAAIEAHAWPGNVRELQNVIRRVVVLHDGERVSAEMLALLFHA